MAWFRKFYECSECGATWTDEWSCACNDRCPSCDTETEPADDEDLTYIVQPDATDRFAVMFSPETAESSADYEVVGTFDNESDALALMQARQEGE